ncbi:hypothetical protein AMK68_05500 [candidate division KD3-62 bacterium DG_56]|uniref:Uncharacterized protein n=1 Tax=candidate division KD3-62 bacterium DG_56 TaxID=1704032 RepID=A0A0S7XHL4_9BACT|nr:MAG: hypothetical protein AMK68_05500 [candidate division KD3-62 bacterium DG_56]
MIKRLLWKEFREQGPFALAALGLVPALLFYDRMVGGDHRPWPSFPTDLWLVFGVLVAWGATRMPREREPSRLSLRALPVRWWQTWALKALPGIAWAGVCTAFACAIGRVGVAATDDGAGGWVVWITAGSMASAYACAFLAGLFWGVGASAVLGLVVGTMAWAALESPSPDYAARAARELWLWVATVPVASAAVMAARARGARDRHHPLGERLSSLGLAGASSVTIGRTGSVCRGSNAHVQNGGGRNESSPNRLPAVRAQS